MTERENLERVVRFERPEYVPATFHINDSCWHHYPNDALRDLMEAHPLLFPGYVRGPVPVAPQFAPWVKAGEPYVDSWGCVWKVPDSGIVGAVVEHPLASWDDFDSFVPPDPDEKDHWGPKDWKAEAVSLGPSISQRCIPNGEIGHNHTWLKLTDIRGYQNALIDMMEEEPRLLRLIGMLTDFNLGLVKNYLACKKIGWMDYAEDLGMQYGPMLSPDLFRKYIKPAYERIMKPAKNSGAIIHVHADGDIRLLAGDLLDCGTDVLNLQDLVNGIDWIAARLKGKVCVELDIDRQSITYSGTPKQIDDLIRQEVECLGSKEGGLMLIYGLYPGVPLANAAAVMDAMERYADYWS